MGNRNKSKVPKSHFILDVAGNISDFTITTMRQSRINKIDFIWYTSQLEPKNMDEALRDESSIFVL